jgi:hypothetical protein
MANNDRQKFRRVKLRIMDKKATCSHAAYEGTYVYCPKKSLITTSRHNILFLPYFSQRLI